MNRKSAAAIMFLCIIFALAKCFPAEESVPIMSENFIEEAKDSIDGVIDEVAVYDGNISASYWVYVDGDKVTKDEWHHVAMTESLSVATADSVRFVGQNSYRGIY